MDLNGLEDLLLPEDQKDTIESFEDVVEYEMGDPTEDKNSKIFYLDDDHNIVDEKDIKNISYKSFFSYTFIHKLEYLVFHNLL